MKRVQILGYGENSEGIVPSCFEFASVIRGKLNIVVTEATELVDDDPEAEEDPDDTPEGEDPDEDTPDEDTPDEDTPDEDTPDEDTGDEDTDDDRYWRRRRPRGYPTSGCRRRSTSSCCLQFRSWCHWLPSGSINSPISAKLKFGCPLQRGLFLKKARWLLGPAA